MMPTTGRAIIRFPYISAVNPTASIPAFAAAASLSDVSPVTPTAPKTLPLASRTRTPPGTGASFTVRDLETTGAGAVLAFERLHIAARIQNDNGKRLQFSRTSCLKRLSDNAARAAQG
jgi:hypothetical protein